MADRMKFSFYDSGTSDSVSITPNSNWTLEHALTEAGGRLKNFSVKDHILFAEVIDHGEVAVHPAILCCMLKQEGKIRAKPKSCKRKAKKDTTYPTNDTEEETQESTSTCVHTESEDRNSDKQDPDNQKLLFVTSVNDGVTKLPCSAYEGKHLCVIVHQKIEDTLLKDGRFADLQELILRESDDRESEVQLNSLAFIYEGQVVKAGKREERKKTKRQRKRTLNPESSTEDVNPVKECVYSQIPAKLTSPFTEETGKSMIQDARQSAIKSFSYAGQPGREAKTDEIINRKAKEFGKKAPDAIPARTLEPLAHAKKSVGYIKCGDIGATCFLIDTKSIITNRHVMNMISTIRSAPLTDPQLKQIYGNIYIYFNYEYPSQPGTAFFVVDETKLLFCIESSELDYVILPIKPNPDMEPDSVVPNIPGLGRSVRTAVPKDGLVVLVGHPNQQYKLTEICRVIPSYKYHAKLVERGTEAENQMDIGENVESIHMYKGCYKSDDHSNQLPYDTSFFEGASGSPVFNPDGHIVAMHTQGYPFRQGSNRYSLMEFAITFNAIYQDVKNRYSDQRARNLFPECERNANVVTDNNNRH